MGQRPLRQLVQREDVRLCELLKHEELRPGQADRRLGGAARNAELADDVTNGLEDGAGGGVFGRRVGKGHRGDIWDPNYRVGKGMRATRMPEHRAGVRRRNFTTPGKSIGRATARRVHNARTMGRFVKVRGLSSRPLATLAAALAAAAGTVACSSATTSEPLAAPWTSTSNRIEVASFTYPQGSLRFDGTRSQLTASQLARVEALKLVPPGSSCPVDYNIATVIVHDESGAFVAYKTVGGDYDCARGAPLLSSATARAFFDSLQCIRAGLPNSGATAFADAPTMKIDDGCLSGVVGLVKGESSWIKVHLTDATKAVRITATECTTGHIGLTFFDPAGNTVVAEGQDIRGDATACAAIEHTFAVATDYYVRVTHTDDNVGAQIFLRASTL